MKLGIGYPSFIFCILKGQFGSLLLCTDSFSGPPYEIRLNMKLFRGLHRHDTPSRTGGDATTSTDDSTTTPTPEPSLVASDVMPRKYLNSFMTCSGCKIN